MNFDITLRLTHGFRKNFGKIRILWGQHDEQTDSSFKNLASKWTDGLDDSNKSTDGYKLQKGIPGPSLQPKSYKTRYCPGAFVWPSRHLPHDRGLDLGSWDSSNPNYDATSTIYGASSNVYESST